MASKTKRGGRRATANPIRGRRQAEQLPLRERGAWHRALEALSRMRRDGVSLTRAAREAEASPATIRRYVGSALGRDGRRWIARPSDRLYRPLQFPTERGLMTLHTTSSRTATRIAEYWAAVHRYLSTGDTRALLAFRGQAIRVGKVAYPFITRRSSIERLAAAGEVRFEDLYATVT